MGRSMRVEYPGAIYHVMNRGDRREPIFKGDEDRWLFLETFEEACRKTSWEVHAYCLMPNHFHLVLETPQPNLVVGMKWFLGTYTIRFNLRHELNGHLFGGRYKAQIVDGSGNGYLRTACEYVHLNPVRAHLVKPEAPLETYRWSSYPDYLQPPRRRPYWLRVDRVLGEFGIQHDGPAERRQFAKAMETRRGEEEPGDWRHLRRGWFLGTDELRGKLLRMIEGSAGRHYDAPPRQETGVQKAERLVREGLAARRWDESDLLQQKKTHPTKVELAACLRSETVMTMDWIANRLRMGCRHTLANCLKAR